MTESTNPMTHRVLTSQKTGSARGANGSRTEGMGEECSPSGQAVDVGSFQHRIAHASQRIESLIVGDHQDDVGTFSRFQVGKPSSQQHHEATNHQAAGGPHFDPWPPRSHAHTPVSRIFFNPRHLVPFLQDCQSAVLRSPLYLSWAKSYSPLAPIGTIDKGNVRRVLHHRNRKRSRLPARGSTGPHLVAHRARPVHSRRRAHLENLV